MTHTHTHTHTSCQNSQNWMVREGEFSQMQFLLCIKINLLGVFSSHFSLLLTYLLFLLSCWSMVCLSRLTDILPLGGSQQRKTDDLCRVSWSLRSSWAGRLQYALPWHIPVPSYPVPSPEVAQGQLHGAIQSWTWQPLF